MRFATRPSLRKIGRSSLVLGAGRDLLIAIIASGSAVLLSLTVQLQTSQEKLREESLRNSAWYVEHHLQFDADGSASIPSSPGNSWATFGYPTLVFGQDGRLLFKTPVRLDLAVVERLSQERRVEGERNGGAGAIRFFEVTLGDEKIIGAALRIGSGAGEHIIEVFKDENAPDVLIDDIVREFPYRSMRMLLPIFGLLLLAGIWIIWRRMRPIAEVAAIADMISPDHLDVRLPERGLPGEVLPIVRGVNRALERLQSGAEKQHEFLRRAAHQLRTPLTVLMARAAALESSEIGRRLRGDVEEIARIIQQLMQLNEIESMSETGERIADIAAAGEAVGDALSRLAAKHDIAIEFARPETPVWVRGDPNLIEIGLRNLVENAIQHSRSGATITLEIGNYGSVDVTDSGPGVPEELRAAIFEPFWSGDASGLRAGLGLTIVRAIAKRCGAAVSVDCPTSGGTVFTVQFQPGIAHGRCT